MILKVFTDGGSKGNPGPMAIGIVFYFDDKEIYKYREDIGYGTNNEAEYTAVITALHKFKDMKTKMNDVNRLDFFSDSQLMVSQLNGIYKVKEPRIRDYIMKIRTLEGEIKLPVRYTHIPRSQNKRADDLVNGLID